MIELVQTSFDDVFKNEFGALDFSRSQNGSGMSSRNEARHLFLGVYLCYYYFDISSGEEIYRNSAVPLQKSRKNAVQIGRT